jgi:hypothetical protein
MMMRNDQKQHDVVELGVASEATLGQPIGARQEMVGYFDDLGIANLD